jgi:hypothetical protein
MRQPSRCVLERRQASAPLAQPEAWDLLSGLWYHGSHKDEIAACVRAVREAGEAAVVAGFGSAEYRAQHATDREFVAALYGEFLGRTRCIKSSAAGELPGRSSRTSSEATAPARTPGPTGAALGRAGVGRARRSPVSPARRATPPPTPRPPGSLLATPTSRCRPTRTGRSPRC